MYENVTYDVILDRMLGRVSNKFDKREGSVIFDAHSPAAIELQILYLELDAVIRESFGGTASRQFLIKRCAERGIAPYPASQALLKGVFTPPDIDVTGKRFNINELNFVVDEKISDGVYKVVCETPGRIGNQNLGAMIPIEYVRGLKTAEITEILIPGEDEEDTEALRKRYFDSFNEKAYGGNVRDYLEKTNSIPGVGGAKVTRIWNGNIAPSSMIPSENVSLWYQSVSESVLDVEIKSWLDAVFTAAKEKKLTTGGTVLLTIIDSDFNPASDDLLNTVQTIIDPEQNAGEGLGIAPIGHIVSVKSVRAVEIDVKTTLSFYSGYSWSNLRPSIEQAVSDYLLELRKSWADSDFLVVRVSQIETRILNVKGVLDIENTLINDHAKNFVLNRFDIPMFGRVVE